MSELSKISHLRKRVKSKSSDNSLPKYSAPTVRKSEPLGPHHELPSSDEVCALCGVTSMLRVTLLLIAVGDTQGGNTDQAAKEKAVRLKTVRQLKEILTELKVDTPATADKEMLRRLALENNAIERYEDLNPGRKRKAPPPPEKKQKAPAGGGAAGPDRSNMGPQFFQFLDKDRDGMISQAEYEGMGALMMGAATPGASRDTGKAWGDHGDQAWNVLDEDKDGFASRAEVDKFFGMSPEQIKQETEKLREAAQAEWQATAAEAIKEAREAFMSEEIPTLPELDSLLPEDDNAFSMHNEL